MHDSCLFFSAPFLKSRTPCVCVCVCVCKSVIPVTSGWWSWGLVEWGCEDRTSVMHVADVNQAKEPYKRDYILQKRPIILSILRTVATPYPVFSLSLCLFLSYMTHVMTRRLQTSIKPYSELLGIRRVSNPFTSIDTGWIKNGYLVRIHTNPKCRFCSR